MAAPSEVVCCPDCGTELGSDAATAGLCPRCLLSLALLGSVLDADSDAGSEMDTATVEDPAAGRILGERYQMREFLGRGGMGEVWRAFDLKLRVDVALKSVRPERSSNEKAHALLRQEVRAAREVVSPNVCRIFDLVVEDGRELVSMEYIDGTTLAKTLRARGPLELQEAREIASQFLAGLQAIHQAGLVHRDVKPENVMLTRAGRVVVMDFGLAKGLGGPRTGTVSGTPAYMSPEQSRGEEVDARADVFAAGIVLAEMLAVGGEGGIESRKALWKAVRESPPRVPESPWAGVLRQALDPSPGARPASARALAQALEEVTLRLPGFEERRPYPGLSSFTEEDAEYFFGREAEVEAVWKKLKRPRLLALIGPSGTGKSSFVRAGLLATLPPGWAAVVTTPGHRPFQALAQALVPSFSGDTVAMQEFAGALLRFGEGDTAVELVSQWRRRHEHGLVVVDQFEELFTLNTAETQAAFAGLLGRLLLEADVHVLLSLRDDFLFHCHAHEALTPILNELTLLGPLSESALRRALVQPALACGYRFEDEALVEEMVGEVGQERGALPLLAFAASRLWEKRDRERGLLTREAYQEIGGVAGALAQHAEATLERIGTQRTPLVREIFRNLVTAQGTRAVRERNELLSVFGGNRASASSDSVRTESGESDAVQRNAARDEAESVLGALVDARLLTSFERAGDEGEGSRQEIEIVHESLLGRWPRLVRWQTQDADGAQLRDQLRQAAQAWHDRGRPEDLLWSGTAYRDFSVWRERYGGGLSATEEAFAAATVRRAGRRRRRRRLAAALVLATASTVAVATSALWRQSERSRREAEAQALQREAAEILALGRLRLDDYPTAALAHAIASLERADSDAARRFAVETLWQGPTAHLLVDDVSPLVSLWSADGRWLALGGMDGFLVLDRDSGTRLQLATTDEHPVGFSADGTRLVSRSQHAGAPFHLWSLPKGELLAEWPQEKRRRAVLFDRRLLTFDSEREWEDGRTTIAVRERSIDGGPETTIAQWKTRDLTGWDIDATGEWLLSVQGGRLLHQRLDRLDRPPRVLGRHEGEVTVWSRPWDGRVATGDATGEVRIWNTATGHLERTLRSPAAARYVKLGPRERFLAAAPQGGGPLRPRELVLFSLDAPRAAAPSPLLQDEGSFLIHMAFDPDGQWLASGHVDRVLLWNLLGARATVLRGRGGIQTGVAFTPDGRLVSISDDGTLRLWPLDPASEEPVRELWSEKGTGRGGLDVDRRGRFAVVAANRDRLFVVPLDGRAAHVHILTAPNSAGPTVNPAGTHVAVQGYAFGDPSAGSVRLVDLASGAERVLRAPANRGACSRFVESWGARDTPAWLSDGRLVSDGATGLRVWDLSTGESRQVRACRASVDDSFGVEVTATPDARSVVSLVLAGSASSGSKDLSVTDLETGVSRDITSHGSNLWTFALDPTGSVLVTGDTAGLVRVGPLDGGEPHLFYGHSRVVRSVAVSPDGRWIASAGADETIRLWPMPQGPPLHTLPYEELMAKLRSLTNLRVVPDAESASGYRIEPGPFPGWAEAPTW